MWMGESKNRTQHNDVCNGILMSDVGKAGARALARADVTYVRT